jgi:hypothetical protein
MGECFIACIKCRNIYLVNCKGVRDIVRAVHNSIIIKLFIL